tara:strand:- start:3775 stop:4284 length:510 start_codon:yes stop_codon:yes gene_type:complete
MIICFDWDNTLVKKRVSEYSMKKRKEIFKLNSESYKEQITELSERLNLEENIIRELFSEVFSILYLNYFSEEDFISSINNLKELANKHTLILASGNHEKVLNFLIQKYNLPFEKVYTTDNLAKLKKVNFDISQIDMVVGDGKEDKELAEKFNAKYIYLDANQDLSELDL